MSNWLPFADSTGPSLAWPFLSKKTQAFALSVDEYSACASLSNGIDMNTPIVSLEYFQSTPRGIGLWETESADEEAMTNYWCCCLATNTRRWILLNGCYSYFLVISILLLLCWRNQCSSKLELDGSMWVQWMPDWPHSLKRSINSYTNFPQVCFDHHLLHSLWAVLHTRLWKVTNTTH